MSHISILAILFGTLVYVGCYYLFLGIGVFYDKWTKGMIYSPETKNPTSPTHLIFVAVLGLAYSFFVNLFMIMSERSGMADGVKTGFMLTLVQFCIPLAIYFKMNEYPWDKYFRIIFFFLVIHTIVGALVGLKGF